MKKLYLITKTDQINYDEYSSWVVRATNKREAIKLTKYDPSVLEVKLIKYEGRTGIILDGFISG